MKKCIDKKLLVLYNRLCRSASLDYLRPSRQRTCASNHNVRSTLNSKLASIWRGRWHEVTEGERSKHSLIFANLGPCAGRCKRQTQGIAPSPICKGEKRIVSVVCSCGCKSGEFVQLREAVNKVAWHFVSNRRPSLQAINQTTNTKKIKKQALACK